MAAAADLDATHRGHDEEREDQQDAGDFHGTGDDQAERGIEEEIPASDGKAPVHESQVSHHEGL